MKPYLKNSIIILCLILGLFLRFYRLESRTSFDADQEWLASRALDIRNGDIALLGPVTSVGGFSIGPGFIYLWTFFDYLTKNDPMSGAYLSVFLGVLTIYFLFIFINKFVNEKVSYIVLFLTAISSTLIFWDQSPWAPSLFYIAQIILLGGAYLSLSKKLGYPIMAFGLALGFHSHFGIFLSLISIFIFLALVRPVKPDLKMIFVTMFILIAGFLPNIVFDATHNFVNFNRLSSIIKGEDVDYYLGFGKIINTMSYNTASIIYPRKINLFDSIVVKTIFAMVIVNGLRNLRDKKYNRLSLLLLVTSIVPPLFFYIQQGKFSEYYLIMTVPSLIILFSLLIKDILNRKFLIIALIALAAYLNFVLIRDRDVNLNLGAKKLIAKQILEKGGTDGYGISLTTQYGQQFGFEYIFRYYGIKASVPPKKGETKIFTVVIPEGYEGVRGQVDYDGIGLRWE